MNAVTTQPSARAIKTICDARAEWGRGNPISDGAVALAEFLNDHMEEPRVEGLVMFLGGWTPVMRMLADALQPGLEWSEEIGRVTDGAVTSKMWLREHPVQFEMITAATASFDPRDSEDVADFEDARARMVGELNAESLGALGTVPLGPLFRFASVADEPSLMQIRGLGIALELPDAGLAALRDACAAALADMRGDARA